MPSPFDLQADYEVKVIHPDGRYEDHIDQFLSLEYTLVVNDVGSMTIVLPGNYPRTFIKPDWRFEIWRTVEGVSRLEGDTQWIIQEIREARDDSGNKTLTVVAYDWKIVLRRRIVAYAPNTGLGYSYNVGTSDDVLKSLFNRNFGTTALDTTRNIATYLPGSGTTGSGVTMGMEFSRQNILDTMQKIAATSRQLGVPLYFDIITQAPPVGLTFLTYINCRGIDRRTGQPNALRIGTEDGNIGAYEISEVYTDEITYVYAGGAGDDDLRLLSTQEDTGRSGRSFYGRKEAWFDFNETTDQDLLDSQAQAALYQNRPSKIFTGRLINTEGTLYGRDWGHGDYVTISTETEAFNCIISAIQVSVSDNGGEAIDAGLRSD